MYFFTFVSVYTEELDFALSKGMDAFLNRLVEHRVRLTVVSLGFMRCILVHRHAAYATIEHIIIHLPTSIVRGGLKDSNPDWRSQPFRDEEGCWRTAGVSASFVHWG